MEGWQAQLHFGCDELLVAAVDLVNGTTFRRQIPKHGVTYLHLLFDRRPIILPEGLAGESYYPAGKTLESLPSSALAEISELFLHIKTKGTIGPASRPSLRGWEASILTA